MEEESEKTGETPDTALPPPAAAAPPFGAWRAPVFWMACGALLAGLAVGAIVFAQRVGVERDLAALAGTLPPPPPPSPSPSPPPPPTPAPAPAPTVAQPVPEVIPATAARPAPRARIQRGPVVAKHVTAQARKAPARLKQKSQARRKASQAKPLYWEVFKRCPLPGNAGAVECRRHICNGAESDGQACAPYRRKRR